MHAAVLGGVIVLLGVALTSSLPSADRNAVITVNLSEAYQAMSGWEVTARLWETNKSED